MIFLNMYVGIWVYTCIPIYKYVYMCLCTYVCVHVLLTSIELRI